MRCRARDRSRRGRHRTDLTPGVEDPGVADAVGPGAVGLERRLVDVPGEHQVGPVLADPAAEVGVAVVAPAGPARRRPERRPVVDPDPARRPARWRRRRAAARARRARPGRPTTGRS